MDCPEVSSHASFGARLYVTVGALIGLSSGFVATVCAMQQHDLDLWGVFGGTFFAPVVVVMVVSALLGRAAANAALREFRLDARDDAMRRRFAAVPQRRIDAIDGGRVRVLGQAREAIATYTNNSHLCIACQQLPDGDAAPTAESAVGTTFVLEDERGALATIDARHVVVAAGYEFSGECVIPPGALVEVVGLASRVVAADGAKGYRDAPTDVILCGTADDPILLRCVR